jgi:hypothetical protein
MKAARITLIAVGALVLAIGTKYLLDEDFRDLLDAVVWLGAGVIAHDAFLAPITLVLMVLSTRYLPGWLRGPAAAGFVVLATVTIAAIPVLGRFGARPDNPSLLDRDYVAGWFVFAGLVLSAVALAAVRRHARLGEGAGS